MEGATLGRSVLPTHFLNGSTLAVYRCNKREKQKKGQNYKSRTHLLPELLPEAHGSWVRGSPTRSGALGLGLFLHMLRRIKVL